MPDIKVDDTLWSTSMLPEGILERWFVADGALVTAGDRIAEIRVEGVRHEVTAPATGRLTIFAAANDLIEPGTLLASLKAVQ
jgi:pyruvate/2-oxoglutarate dehydrogenase complex dihydrolipoamide acyltransferase (E2) component